VFFRRKACPTGLRPIKTIHPAADRQGEYRYSKAIFPRCKGFHQFLTLFEKIRPTSLTGC
jgi:hypothetical protein